MARATLTLERLMRWVEPEPNTGCWLWTGTLDPCGYARLFVDGKSRTDHRLAWRLFRGEIPNGCHVLHSCDTRCCVSVDHMSLGTHQDNMSDMARRSRSAGRGKTKMFGAYPDERGRFQSRCSFHGVDYYLGRFDSAEEASAVAVAFKEKCYREGAPK